MESIIQSYLRVLVVVFERISHNEQQRKSGRHSARFLLYCVGLFLPYSVGVPEHASPGGWIDVVKLVTVCEHVKLLD
ncbi:MAG: hypothetical protein PWP09_1871 [Thermotogota bacterium]|nr:hypothetical protein [Thermotogota bacterium]